LGIHDVAKSWDENVLKIRSLKSAIGEVDGNINLIRIDIGGIHQTTNPILLPMTCSFKLISQCHYNTGDQTLVYHVNSILPVLDIVLIDGGLKPHSQRPGVSQTLSKIVSRLPIVVKDTVFCNTLEEFRKKVDSGSDGE
jgi:hypothetical protein